MVLLLHCSCNCILLLLGILVEIVHDSRGVTTDLSTVQTEAGLQPPNKNPTRPSDSLVLVKHVLQQLLLPLSSDKDAASHCRLVGTPYYYHGTAVQIQLGGRPRGTRQLMAATVPLFRPPRLGGRKKKRRERRRRRRENNPELKSCVYPSFCEPPCIRSRGEGSRSCGGRKKGRRKKGPFQRSSRVLSGPLRSRKVLFSPQKKCQRSSPVISGQLGSQRGKGEPLGGEKGGPPW